MWGERNTIKNNLITVIQFPGTFNGRVEKDKFTWDAGLEINEASDLVVTGNVVAGSERTGIRTDGQSCDLLQLDPSALFSENEVHSCLIGVMALQDGIKPCSVLSGFTTWRNWYFGTYFQSEVRPNSIC